MRSAFLVWNPFQVIQFHNIAKRGTDVTFVIIDRKDNNGQFTESVKALMPGRIEILPSRRILEIDGRFDVIFFQAPFRAMELLRKSRLVSVQYGLAKEAHNYGAWRSLADLNLMYGPYSREKVASLSPSISIGNTKFDGWRPPSNSASKVSAKIKKGFDPTKKLLLYMPTWGDLGTCAELLPLLGEISDRYDIVLKIHHNNEVKVKQWRELAISAGVRHIFDGAADQLDLLSCADLVVSDYSGAIFDATYARVPVLLYQPGTEQRVGVQKFTLDSLEFARRHDIGLVCGSATEFRNAVEMALASSETLVEQAEKLRSELFIDVDVHPGGISAWEAVDRLVGGKLPALDKPQMSLRRRVKVTRRLDRRIKALRSNFFAARDLLARWIAYLSA